MKYPNFMYLWMLVIYLVCIILDEKIMGIATLLIGVLYFLSEIHNQLVKLNSKSHK